MPGGRGGVSSEHSQTQSDQPRCDSPRATGRGSRERRLLSGMPSRDAVMESGLRIQVERRRVAWLVQLWPLASHGRGEHARRELNTVTLVLRTSSTRATVNQMAYVKKVDGGLRPTEPDHRLSGAPQGFSLIVLVGQRRTANSRLSDTSGMTASETLKKPMMMKRFHAQEDEPVWWEAWLPVRGNFDKYKDRERSAREPVSYPCFWPKANSDSRSIAGPPGARSAWTSSAAPSPDNRLNNIAESPAPEMS